MPGIYFNTRPIAAATKIIYCSFTFFAFTKTIMVVNAITAVGTSFIVRVAITITAPAYAPITAAVMPSTNALMPGFLPYFLK